MTTEPSMQDRCLSPADFADSPLSRVLAQPLILGLFLPVQDGGWSASTAPRGTTWTFDYNQALVRQAEDLGFDLVFGLAQWVGKGGYGGALHYREQSLDPFITTAALAGCTSRILLISTIHVLYGPWHPLHLAKFGATLDHISGGRWGLNVVTGHAPKEPLMFGQQMIPHDQRYTMAAEFVSIMEHLWSDTENWSHQGQFWSLADAYVTPKPRFGRPILVNASGSPAGFDFAGRFSDLAFITSPAGADLGPALAALPAHTAAIRAAARAHGRTLRTVINPMIVCRPTEAEARRYHAEITGAADEGAIDGFVAKEDAADSQAWRGHRREHRALGGNVHLVGSPEQIVDQITALHDAGCDGIQLTFFDFAPDLAYFGEAVLPLLRQAGLR